MTTIAPPRDNDGLLRKLPLPTAATGRDNGNLFSRFNIKLNARWGDLPHGRTLQMARILVIDDDEAIRSVLTMLLGQKNHEVVTAQNGLRGLKALECEDFDLLIVDLFMPEMDGLETIRIVRKDNTDLPIIVMSGSGNRTEIPDFLAMATKLGAVESIPKPFRPRELFEIVDKCLQTKPAGGSSPSP